jgi:uncharacterized protein YqgV (UPF0045/DUF77 family)
MKVTVMFSVIPIGTGVSLSEYIAACERVLAETDLVGAPRISTFIKLGTRTDRTPDMDAMVRSVQSKL